MHANTFVQLEGFHGMRIFKFGYMYPAKQMNETDIILLQPYALIQGSPSESDIRHVVNHWNRMIDSLGDPAYIYVCRVPKRIWHTI